MKAPLKKPLILIADDKVSEVSTRLDYCLPLFVENPALEAQRILLEPDVLHDVGPALIAWSQSTQPQHYIHLAEGHRVILILDIDWDGEIDYGITGLARPLHRDPKFWNRCILLLKTTSSAAEAERWRRTVTSPLRSLRSGMNTAAGRIRYLAANREEIKSRGQSSSGYEREVISKALLDLQEEAIFDALSQGKWPVTAVAGAIQQLSADRFYGAFGDFEDLGNLYVKRVLSRYHHRELPACWGTPLNLGITRIIDDKEPNTLTALGKTLSGARGHEVVGLLSSLVDYGEVAAVESFLFQLAPAAGRDIARTNMGAAQSKWNPSKLADKSIPLRRLNREKIDAALMELQTVLSRFSTGSKLTDERFTNLIDVFNPVDASADDQGITHLHEALAEARAFVLSGMPSAAAELLEIAFSDIEEELTEQALIRTSKSGIESCTALVTFELDFENDQDRGRLGYEGKRIRLLNRKLLHHPAVEASRLVAVQDQPVENRIVAALGTYVQCPEAIAELARLRDDDPTAFTKCVRTLNETIVETGLPVDFKTFDKVWKRFWQAQHQDTLPAVLDKLFDPEFMRGPFSEAIASYNCSEKGKSAPVRFLSVSLLELLLTHLAFLEFRIRSFCTLIGNRIISEKNAGREQLRQLASAIQREPSNGSFQLQLDKLRDNIRDLWKSRSWHEIFSKPDLLAGENPFDPDLPWAEDGGLLRVLREIPIGQSCWKSCQAYLVQYEIDVLRNGDLRYRSPISSWLRFGNLALPSQLVANLPDRPQRQRGAVSFDRIENKLRSDEDPSE